MGGIAFERRMQKTDVEPAGHGGRIFERIIVGCGLVGEASAVDRDPEAFEFVRVGPPGAEFHDAVGKRDGFRDLALGVVVAADEEDGNSGAMET